MSLSTFFGRCMHNHDTDCECLVNYSTFCNVYILSSLWDTLEKIVIGRFAISSWIVCTSVRVRSKTFEFFGSSCKKWKPICSPFVQAALSYDLVYDPRNVQETPVQHEEKFRYCNVTWCKNARPKISSRGCNSDVVPGQLLVDTTALENISLIPGSIAEMIIIKAGKTRNIDTDYNALHIQQRFVESLKISVYKKVLDGFSW